LVGEYRIERARQEEEFDIKYGGATTEVREHRGKLVTFKSWLIANKGSGKD